MYYLKNWLEILILAQVQDTPMHGYDIGEKLNERSRNPIKSGTLYPLLRRLEQRGLVISSWQTSQSGPAKKVYSITDVGRQELNDGIESWQDFSLKMNNALSRKEKL